MFALKGTVLLPLHPNPNFTTDPQEEIEVFVPQITSDEREDEAIYQGWEGWGYAHGDNISSPIG